MQLMRRFLRRSPGDQCLIAMASGAAAVVQLLVQIAPYRYVDRTLAGVGGWLTAIRPLRAVAPGRLIWAVDAVSRTFGISCLPQALIGRLLLAAHGWTCEIRFGVQRPLEGGLQAHAWLERDGETLIGATPLPVYEPLVKRHA
jgi:hypothetical protein